MQDHIKICLETLNNITPLENIFFHINLAENGDDDRSSEEHLKNPKPVEVLS
jgi:hypothetical protein